MPKVLIIEDTYGLRMIMRSFLIKKGYKVKDAKDGERALQMIRNDTPDVIITDMLMPEKDGFDTIQEIRKNKRDIPIIIVTGLEDPMSQDMAQELGVSKILIKPFSEDDFIEAVEESLKIHRYTAPSL